MVLMGITSDDYGYEKALGLERRGYWQEWLGASGHEQLQAHLVSCSAWVGFLSAAADVSTDASELQLGLRVRALLLDDGMSCMSLSDAIQEREEGSREEGGDEMAQGSVLSDGIYLTLEDDISDWKQMQEEQSELWAAISQKEPLPSERVFLSNIDVDPEDLDSFTPGLLTWRKLTKPARMRQLAHRIAQQHLPFAEREASQRRPAQMAAYVAAARATTSATSSSNQSSGARSQAGRNQLQNDSNGLDGGGGEGGLQGYLLELAFFDNCVPDIALTSVDNRTAEIVGLIDSVDPIRLPGAQSGIGEASGGRSGREREREVGAAGTVGAAGGGGAGGGDVACSILGEDQARQKLQEALAAFLDRGGCGGARRAALEVFADVVEGYVTKLASDVRAIADRCQDVVGFGTPDLVDMTVSCCMKSSISELAQFALDPTAALSRRSSLPTSDSTNNNGAAGSVLLGQMQPQPSDPFSSRSSSLTSAAQLHRFASNPSAAFPSRALHVSQQSAVSSQQQQQQQLSALRMQHERSTTTTVAGAAAQPGVPPHLNLPIHSSSLHGPLHGTSSFSQSALHQLQPPSVGTSAGQTAGSSWAGPARAASQATLQKLGAAGGGGFGGQKEGAENEGPPQKSPAARKPGGSRAKKGGVESKRGGVQAVSLPTFSSLQVPTGGGETGGASGLGSGVAGQGGMQGVQGMSMLQAQGMAAGGGIAVGGRAAIESQQGNQPSQLERARQAQGQPRPWH